jgi:hypothetical protein
MKAITPTKSPKLWLGVGLLSLAALSTPAANTVTFSVDMTVQIYTNAVFDPTNQLVDVRGDFNGWADTNYVYTLTNNGSGIYTNTFDLTNTAGSVLNYKYVYYTPPSSGSDNWESPASTCGNNRTFTLAGGAQVLPTVYFNDAPPVQPNNNVKIQVDMTALVVTGAFTNGTSVVTVSGDFTGWGDGTGLTNDPSLLGTAKNIYSLVTNIPGVVGACHAYKFRANGGWENPPSTGGGNRTFQIAGGGSTQVLPLVSYNDASVCGLVQATTPVTFVVNVPDGTPNADGSIQFTNGVNKLYLNGEFLGWWAWYDGIPGDGGQGPDNEMTNNPPGSTLFQQTFMVQAGASLDVTYKYSIDGYDNEAGFQVNHTRYVRTLATVPYTMPVDRFGTNAGPPLMEGATSNIVIGAESAGHIPISWAGMQCLTLQTKSALGSPGGWVNLPATEGTSFTNWPVGATPQYFRWQKLP